MAEEEIFCLNIVAGKCSLANETGVDGVCCDDAGICKKDAACPYIFTSLDDLDDQDEDEFSEQG
jgi:hypothetical protein